jgi:nucleoside-diphosphate-sugar epimerase
MNVLVTGANGFVGRAVVRRLAQLRIKVRGAMRQAVPVEGCEPIAVGDIGARTDWREALAGIDVVVHLAARVHVMRDTAADPLAAFRAVNVEGTLALATASKAAGVRRFVFVSSVKVNGEATFDQPYSETDAAHPLDAYGISKWEAEQQLERALAGAIELIVLRPPLVYGPGVRGNFRALLDAVARRRPLPLGAIANRRSLVYVENLADALARCVSHEAAVNRTYLVSDGEDISSPDLVRALAAGMELAPRLIAVPPGLLLAAGRLLGRGPAVERLTGSLQIDSRRIRCELGWSPPYTLAEGLAATARWYRRERDAAAV